jgi:anti-anti-sigma factor
MSVLQTHERVGPGLPLVEVLVRQPDLSRPGWLSAQLDDVLRVRPERVVVDLGQCSTIDAAGLRVLLEAHCELRRRGGVLVLRGLCPRLERVIGLTGLTEVFDVEGRARC